MGKSEVGISLDGDLTNGAGDFPTYVPGQIVSGKVHLSLQAQKKIECIDVEFEGKCFTEITRKSNSNQNTRYKETLDLFQFSKRVFEGPYTMQPCTMEWPFSFTFPERCSLNYETIGASDPRFDHEPQPMPPSLDVEAGFSRPVKAKIYYQIIATVNPRSFLGSKKSVLPLVLVPYSRTPLPYPDLVDIQIDEQSWRSNSLRPEKHSLMQRMSYVFSSDPSLKTPSINFSATSLLPKFASIWQPFPTAISIQYHQLAPTDPEQPTLVLDEVILQIKQYTQVKVKGLLGAYVDLGKQILAASTFRLGVTLPLDGQPVQTTENFKLADMLPEHFRLAPNFKSYNVHQSYRLKMFANVVHPETGHRFKLKAKTAFTIMPIENPNPPSFAAAPHELTPMYAADDGDTLPSYEGAASSSAQPPYSRENQQHVNTDGKSANGSIT